MNMKAAPTVAVVKTGGANRGRTGDLTHAMRALYQLSYSPKKKDMIHSILKNQKEKCKYIRTKKPICQNDYTIF